MLSGRKLEKIESKVLNEWLVPQLNTVFDRDFDKIKRFGKVKSVNMAENGTHKPIGISVVKSIIVDKKLSIT